MKLSENNVVKPIKVFSYDECAEQAGISSRQFQREIADGKGPPVIAITARRRGVLEEDFTAWILARRRSAPAVTAKRGVSHPTTQQVA